MTSDWKECNLEKVIELVIDYRGKTPKKLGGDWSNSGYRALSAKNIKTGFIVQPESIRYVDEDLYKKWMKDEIKRGDILITSEAPFGQIYYWDSDEKVVLSQRIFGLRINNNFVSKYVYYYMITKNFQAELDARATGTTVVGLRQPELLKCNIQFPDKKTQQKIARVLSSIDDKIELNNAINKNLEQQAQAIFDNFIDNTESNNIKVADITLTANTGADAIQKAPIVDFDTGVKCIRVGDMSNDRDIYQWGFTKVTDEDFKQYQLKKDDILVTRTATLGLNRLITSDLNAVYNNGLIRLTVDKTKIYPLFLYRQFQTQDFFNFISRIESETSVRPNMKINYLLSYEFKCPNIDKQENLIGVLNPIMQLIESYRVENNSLTQLRDTLLPKLMNGEIDVDKVEV